MSMQNQFERETQLLEKDLQNGFITIQHYNQLLKELQRDYLAAAEESAQQHYDDEFNQW